MYARPAAPSLSLERLATPLMRFVFALTMPAFLPSHALAEEEGKQAIYANEMERKQYGNSEFQFVPAMRAGDFVFLSGVVAGRRPDIAVDEFTKEDYEKSVRRAFERINQSLIAAGGSSNDLVHLRTYHIFDTGMLDLSFEEHAKIISHVKKDFVEEPFHSWTAIGASKLFIPTALVEIEAVAFIPQKE